MMTDEELIARLRDYLDPDEGKVNDARAEAADRIEALKVDLEKMGRTAVKINETLGWEAGRREAAEARAERLEAALRNLLPGLRDNLPGYADNDYVVFTPTAAVVRAARAELEGGAA